MKGMRVLIAPDKFKGSLDASAVAESIAHGIRDVLPDAAIEIAPVADGGEGTAEAICTAQRGTWVKSPTHDPFGRGIDARFAYIENRRLAVIEMSEAAGMRRLREQQLDPFRATTFGVGEMILHAGRHGAQTIIVGLGGSATNDGGFGMARAFGYRFFEGELEHELRSAVSHLAKLKAIEVPPNLSLPKIIGAADVRNPLTGKNGATRVFGPQKGAGPEKIEVLERAMTRLADIAAKRLRVDHRNVPGAGAAGGLGFGLMTFCGATMRPGFAVVAEAVGLEAKVKSADIVITGEGKLDRQTLEGKTAAGVADLAHKSGKRVFAIVAQMEDDGEVRKMFDKIYAFGGTIPEAKHLLRQKGQELAKDLRGTLK